MFIWRSFYFDTWCIFKGGLKNKFIKKWKDTEVLIRDKKGWIFLEIGSILRRLLMKRFNLFGFLLFRERAGVISPGPCWVITYDCYMHCDENLLRLLWNVITEYKHDRHLVGY